MSGPRFIVTEFAGIRMPERPDGSDGNYITSYYVQDTERQYEVVATFENTALRHHVTLAILRRRAERECERLNAWDKAVCDA